MGGGGFLQSYMRIFGQEGIGRPDLEADSDIKSIQKVLAQGMFEDEIPEIKAALVFTAEGVEIDVNDAPIPALPLKKLKDFVRQRAKEKPIKAQELEKVKEVLPE